MCDFYAELGGMQTQQNFKMKMFPVCIEPTTPRVATWLFRPLDSVTDKL